MNGSGKEYAAALFTLAREDGIESGIFEDLEFISSVFTNVPQYVTFLDSRAVSEKERTDNVKRNFSGTVHEYVISLICLLIQKHSVRDLSACAEEYRALYYTSVDRASAVIRSAVPLSDEEKKKLRRALEKSQNKSVEAEYVVDESLIGGITVEIDGTVMDGSLRHRISELREAIK